MKLTLRLAVIGLCLSVGAIALWAGVTCPWHTYATCTPTGQYRYPPGNGVWEKYHCTCGDDVWVQQ